MAHGPPHVRDDMHDLVLLLPCMHGRTLPPQVILERLAELDKIDT